MNTPRVKIIIPEPYGFCSGVKRALRLIQNALKKTSTVPIITLGELIHNPQVLLELKKANVVSVKSLNELTKYAGVKKAFVVIRSHGCAPEIKEAIRKMGFKIIDATCPTVNRVSRYAQQLYNEGYFVVVIGNKDHPEVKGILGHVPDKTRIAVYNSQIPQQLRNKAKKIALLAQTTITKEEFLSVIARFNVLDFEEVRIVNTLCKEAQLRQSSCQNLKNCVELIIVIGGRNSANTKSLCKLASGARAKVIQVTRSQELLKSRIVRKMFSKPRSEITIGIISGASTPKKAVTQVVATLKSLAQNARLITKFSKSHFKEVLNNNE